MVKKRLFSLFVLCGLFLPLIFCSAKVEPDADRDGLSDWEEKNIYGTNFQKADTDGDGLEDAVEVYSGSSPLKKGYAPLTFVDLAAPYTNEAPDDVWTGPWKNACEEASMAMVEKYYLGQRTMTKAEAKDFMQMLFDKQNKIYGSNADSDSTRTAYLINNFSSYGAVIKDKPTIEEIKAEINGRRPVIALHYGFDLKNKNIPFLAAGSSYHMTVIVGYDDVKKEFIVNDSGDRKVGKNHRYGYDLFMSTLHDFNFKTKKANGPARVIFTYPKLIKTAASSRIFYTNGKTLQYITNPVAFASHKWDWRAVNIVGDLWLKNFSIGANIDK
jgi:hypothetical protein